MKGARMDWTEWTSPDGLIKGGLGAALTGVSAWLLGKSKTARNSDPRFSHLEERVANLEQGQENLERQYHTVDEKQDALVHQMSLARKEAVRHAQSSESQNAEVSAKLDQLTRAVEALSRQ